MRVLLAVLLVLAMVGCSPSASNTAVDANNAGISIPDAEKAYAWKVLDALDRFTKIANQSQFVDNDTAQEYLKTKKPTQSMLDNLKKGSTDGMALVKELKEMQPPARLQAFHDQAMRSTQQKADNIAGLLLAMEQNDKNEIAKVLDSIDKTAAASKAEMDKILKGKTAEQYLGVAP